MNKRKILVVIVCLAAVAAACLSYVIAVANGTIGVSADNLERDARKSQNIDDTWAVSKSVDKNLGAMIFYNDTLDEHIFSVYVNHNPGSGSSLGYLFREGGRDGSIATGIGEFSFPSVNSIALLSMNKDCAAEIWLDNGKEIEVFDIDPDKPFAFVIPNNLKSVALYDADGNLIPIPSTDAGDSQIPAPNAYLPQVLIDGTTYYLKGTRHTSDLNVIINESEYLGRIESVVALTRIPTENKQANFGIEGAPYSVYENGIVVLWDGIWTLFVEELFE